MEVNRGEEMKKKLYLSLIVTFLVAGGFLIYKMIYPIGDIESYIEHDVLEDFVTHKEEKANLIKIVQIDNSDTYLAFFTAHQDSKIRYATLRKAPIGSNFSSHVVMTTSDSFSHQPVKTDKGVYTVLYGENKSLQIKSIDFTLFDEMHQIDVGENVFFTWYQKEPSDEEKRTKTWDTMFDITFFDHNGDELKREEL